MRQPDRFRTESPIEGRRENEDGEAAFAKALGRSFRKRRHGNSLVALTVVAAGALALFAIHLLLKQNSYLVMAALIGLPWVLYAWLARKGAVGVFLSWMWSAIVCFVLTEGYLGYVSLVDRTTDLSMAGIGGGILLAAIAIHRPQLVAKSNRPLAVFTYCFLAMYSYAAIFAVNCTLDRSPATNYRPVLLQKIYGFRSQGLLVEAWSPSQRWSAASLLLRRGGAMVRPSAELFRRVREGDTILVAQRNGSLGMSWFVAQSTSAPGGKVALGPFSAKF